MPDLQQLIARHEAAQEPPIALTPLSQARVAAQRLGCAVVALEDPKDRLDVLNLATAEALRLLRADAPTTA